LSGSFALRRLLRRARSRYRVYQLLADVWPSGSDPRFQDPVRRMGLPV